MKGNGKTKPEIRLQIGGRDYPCRVTMGAMIRFKRDTGVDVSKLDTSDMESMVRFVWHCVASASKVDGVEFNMKFEDFADHLDPTTLNGFYAEMAEDNDGGKKKVTTPSA
jgi:hypothetical protein